MNIQLSKAYRLLRELDASSNHKSLNDESIIEEIETADDEVCSDISDFNSKLKSIQSLVDSSDFSATAEDLIMLRLYAMNISSVMNNLVEEIDSFIQKTDLYND